MIGGDMRQVEELVGALPVPVLLIGRDSRVLAANTAAMTLLGADPVGRHHGLAFRQPALLDAIASALRGDGVIEVRHAIPGPSQELVYRVNVAPVSLGVVLSFTDLSEQEQIGQMRRDFVANVSHELRTPLTALMGFIETLRGPAREDSAARERFLAIMSREAERMNRLVRDLLHLSRVEAEERLRPTRPVDIAGLIRASATALRPLAEESGMQIELHGVDARFEAPADGDQITQILHNLIENAIKYGASGGRVLVTLGDAEGARGAMVRIDVRDFGEGIDEIHIGRLTERFYRVDGHRSREKGGTGLGLAIVKHVVNRHRGRLLIESRLGSGSCFSVLIPKKIS
jgi:two-component system phosphate regulon sensor histidine kinase PhoR